MHHLNRKTICRPKRIPPQSEPVALDACASIRSYLVRFGSSGTGAGAGCSAMRLAHCLRVVGAERTRAHPPKRQLLTRTGAIIFMFKSRYRNYAVMYGLRCLSSAVATQFCNHATTRYSGPSLIYCKPECTTMGYTHINAANAGVLNPQHP